MIFLAIDEMQNAECRMQNEAEAAPGSWPRPHSAFCILHPALPSDVPTAEEEHLKQVYAKGRDE
jgi:hypothetical protein